MDDELVKLLSKNILQDIPILHIIKVFVAIKELEYESNIEGFKPQQ